MITKRKDIVMISILRKGQELIAPTPEDLWLRGGADIRSTEIEHERHENVPFFDLEIAHRGTQYTRPLLDNLARAVGKTVTRTYVTSDGIDRATRVFLPDNANDDFLIAMTTPWWTSVDGLNHANAATMATELQVPVALIGAEHSARRYNLPLDVLRVAHTAKRSTTISLAKTAQSNQLILADLRMNHDLPNGIVKTGESRGAMVTDGEYAYANLYGAEILYQDKTALCLPDQLFSEASDSDALLQFPGSELIGAGYVTVEAIKKHATKRFLGTVSLNPNFIVSSLIGVGPALASGEAGRFIQWLPKNAAGHQVTYKFDRASRPERQRELYADHHNIAIITLVGSHATLAHTETLRHVIERIDAFGHEIRACSGDITRINWNNVHLKDDDRYKNMVR